MNNRNILIKQYSYVLSSPRRFEHGRSRRQSVQYNRAVHFLQQKLTRNEEEEKQAVILKKGLTVFVYGQPLSLRLNAET